MSHPVAAEIAQRLRTLQQKLARTPNDPVLYGQLGLALGAKGDMQGALQALEKAVELCPTYGEGFANRALALQALGRDAEAFDAAATASELTPQYADALAIARTLAGRLRRPVPETGWKAPRPGLFARLFTRSQRGEPSELPRDEAGLRQALAADRGDAAAAMQLGALLNGKKRLAEAEAFLRYALALDGAQPKAVCVLAEILDETGRTGEAISLLSDAAARGMQDTRVLLLLLRHKQQLSYWQGYAVLEQTLAARLQDAPGSVVPSAALYATTDPRVHLESARIYAEGIAARTPAVVRPARAGHEGCITVGCMSADFHQHPVATLVAGLFESHDRARFRVHGYALGLDDGSDLRRRIEKGCDKFVELTGAGTQAAASRIASDGVDILVDLTGYTMNGRPDVLAARPAPIQINYLGYPGTMGAPFIDYALVDRNIAPPGDEAHYSEKLIFLPTYQINDRARVRPSPRRRRAEAGLPEEATVFCNFNGNRKFTPQIFEAWAKILKGVPGSMLWVSGGSKASAANLEREAAVRGLADRLLLSDWTPTYVDHLERYALADLFLDSFPYTAHTTAGDALWMGCPLVTCRGRTFAGRIAASVLVSAGLEMLATTSLEDYVALAIRLGNDRPELARLRRFLEDTRLKSRLFDTVRTTCELEWAYGHVWARYRAGEAPASFEVA